MIWIGIAVLLYIGIEIFTDYYVNNQIKTRRQRIGMFVGTQVFCFCLSNQQYSIVENIMIISIVIFFFSISWIDILYMIIPDSILLFVLIPIFVYTIICGSFLSTERIISIFLISLPMLMTNIYVKESFGGGDIKLIAVLGYVLGYQVVIAFCIAVLIASMEAIIRYYFMNTNCFAFGQYLCLGFIITFFYHDQIILLLWNT